MRVLTVRQPWAWVIIHGGKSVENRTRNIAGSYRGPVAIHAGLTEATEAYEDGMVREVLGRYDDSWLMEEQLGQRGTIIGVVTLWAVHRDRDNGLCCPPDGSRNWAMRDHWHLNVANPIPLATPIPAKGRLGLWRPDDELRAAIEEQL